MARAPLGQRLTQKRRPRIHIHQKLSEADYFVTIFPDSARFLHRGLQFWFHGTLEERAPSGVMPGRQRTCCALASVIPSEV